MEYTYELNRKCKNCGEPIADQAHAARKFCPRIVLEDGSIQSCKDDYNSRVNKPLNLPYTYFAKCHKRYYDGIKEMLDNEGDNVTLEIINRYGINLYRPFEFKIKQGRFIFYYHALGMEQLADKKYKIFKHALF